MTPRRRPARVVARTVARTVGLVVAVLGAALARPCTAAALQAPRPAPDTLRLGALHRLAAAADARAAQVDLLGRQSALRDATLRAEGLPAVSATGVAQYLSDVATVRPVPGGPAFGPPNEQTDTYLSIRQSLLDPTRGARRAVERAQLAEAQAGVRSALWQQRTQVNDAFFAILLRDAQRAALDAALTDLGARRRVAADRVAAGAALRSEVEILDAELARRRQSLDELVADREASRAILTELVGRPLAADAVLALPEAAPEPVREDSGAASRRPEYDQFARSRAVAEARRSALAAQTLPRVALVARSGYGRPGLNQLGRDLDGYYIAGIQVEWAPWNWGATRREREAQVLQSRIVGSAEAAFTAGLRRAALAEQGRITALERALAADERIIALRARILDETRHRHDEGDVTVAEYVARQAELLAAQLDRAQRRVRLAEARVRYLTTLGYEIR